MKKIKEPISQNRWEFAQAGERGHHDNDPKSLDGLRDHYREVYKHYFKYLSINPDLSNKSIIEIGPAKFAALLYCENYDKSYIIEPTLYEDIGEYYEGKNIEFITDLYEDCDSPKVDEIWFLNVLQHVKHPDALIAKAKEHSKIIRFFEPIDTLINQEHPFSFSENDYINYFGDCVTRYTSIGEKPFHGANCAYGIYKCEE